MKKFPPHVTFNKVSRFSLRHSSTFRLLNGKRLQPWKIENAKNQRDETQFANFAKINF